jgi:hypothetical protein
MDSAQLMKNQRAKRLPDRLVVGLQERKMNLTGQKGVMSLEKKHGSISMAVGLQTDYQAIRQPLCTLVFHQLR